MIAELELFAEIFSNNSKINLSLKGYSLGCCKNCNAAYTDNFTLSIDLSSDFTISILVRATLKSFRYKVSFKSAI